MKFNPINERLKYKYYDRIIGIKRLDEKTQAQYLLDQKNTHWDLYDIEKFYQNVLYKHIFDFFHTKMRCNRKVARILANLSSFDGGFYVEYSKLHGKELKAMIQTKHIMTGSPLSQRLGFLCFKDTFDTSIKFVSIIMVNLVCMSMISLLQMLQKI